ncbi:hypothetical protein RSOLAG1IB_05608 [Rhizoctonia solani AG-1 IB]|uniref:Carbonic anhydrase n=1 Tax=Thanatephorus cucumeris (strain AG1-IB / isolate 7/3/14) TaxID=1108050 RepID=A0A0B7G404_THACB|nr:hypothetical protein RSOLAG1IB_05608 [Rhizoctonia solani AG-1 IB]
MAYSLTFLRTTFDPSTTCSLAEMSISEKDILELSEIEYASRDIYPGPRVTIVTCMDPRINMQDIYAQLKVHPGNAFILRNAGGRAQEALRSIIVSQNLLNTTDVHIIHHTKCGMANHSEESLRIRLLQSFAENDPEVNKSTTMHQLNQRHFFPIHSHRCTHQAMAALQSDLALLENYPLIKQNKGGSKIKMHGWLYDIATHTLTSTERPQTKQALCERCECPFGEDCGCVCSCHPEK